MQLIKTTLALGFRPFFLLGGLAAAILIPVWVLMFSGILPVAAAGWDNPIHWHAHEMIFGFGMAIVAGFLATATQNWTGIPGIKGTRLALLVVPWIVARVCPYIGLAGTWSYLAIDMIFPVLFTIFISKYLMAPGQARNRVIYLLLAMIIVGNAAVHAEALGFYGYGQSGLRLGLWGIVGAVALIGGRVIPFFTKNATGTNVKVRPRVERAATLTFYATVLCDLVHNRILGGQQMLAVVAVGTAIIHGIRWSGWGWRAALKIPVLWILHVGYLFLVLGIALRGLDPWLNAHGTPATHALAIGAIGITAYGMMTRVALGHTGRPIQPARLIASAYGLLVGAGVVRIIGTFLPASFYLVSVNIAGWLWAVAFLLYVVIYTPILTAPRLDGKPG